MSHTDKNIVMVEFDEFTWSGFAGAVYGPLGEVPRINDGAREVMLDGMLAIVIADYAGVTILESDGDGEWHLQLANHGLAVWVAERLGERTPQSTNLDTIQLRTLGFVQR